MSHRPGHPHPTQAPSATSPDASLSPPPASEEWREYWTVVLPAVVSVFTTWTLVLLLIADVVVHGGHGAVGGMLAWLGVAVWRARPGSEAALAGAVAARRHIPGTWRVARPAVQAAAPESSRGAPSGVAGAAGTPAPGPVSGAATHPSPREAHLAVIGGAVTVVADVVVAFVVLVGGAWPTWTAVLAAGLVVHQLWLLRRIRLAQREP